MENSIKTYEEAYTKYRKGFNGWVGETLILGINGYDWKISTGKGNKGLSASAQGGISHDEGAYRTFKFMMFSDPSVNLTRSDRRCTEKAVREMHAQALILFDQKLEAGELPSKADPDYEIKPGQKLFLDHPQSPMSNLVIYNLEIIRGEIYYQFVNTKTLALGQTEIINDYEDRFGIGYYYHKGEVMKDLDELNNIVIEAKAKKKLDQERKEEEREAKQRELDKKIVAGKRLVNIPDWAEGIIVAHFKEDKSEIQADYHAHHSVKTVYLAFSKHNRDLFSEMRKAALKYDETKHLADAPEEWEHREKYSMGAGYYLGQYHHSGWEIRKGTLHRDIGELNKLYIAAAEGRYLCEMKDLSLPTSTNEVELPSSEMLSFHETKHTKKGHDLFVVKLEEQIERDEFLALKNLAKKHNGYYSSFRGSGAIPGFHFLEKEDALLFLSNHSSVSNS